MTETGFTIAIHRLDTWLARVVQAICVTLLAVIVITITASVFSRFVIFTPLNFADALAKYLMQWMAFLGVGLAIRSGEHVLVDMLAARLSLRHSRILLILINILVTVLFATVAYYGTLNALSGLKSHDPFVFGISMAIPYFSVVAGAVYALIQSNLSTWLHMRDPAFRIGIAQHDLQNEIHL